MLSAGKLRRYVGMGALIAYVNSTIMDLLEQSTDFTRKIEMTQIAEGGIGLETRITDIDGVTLIEVIDDERFYDKFDFTDGFVPVADTSHKINVLIASPLTVKCVPKISSIYYIKIVLYQIHLYFQMVRTTRLIAYMLMLIQQHILHH